jgi:hypothetical protein
MALRLILFNDNLNPGRIYSLASCPVCLKPLRPIKSDSPSFYNHLPRLKRNSHTTAYMSSVYTSDLAGSFPSAPESPSPFLITHDAAETQRPVAWMLLHTQPESHEQSSPSSQAGFVKTCPNTESPSPTAAAQFRRALLREGALIFDGVQSSDITQSLSLPSGAFFVDLQQSGANCISTESTLILPQAIKLGTAKFWQPSVTGRC